MAATETLAAWHSEIAAEIEQLESELVVARTEQTEAQAEYQGASDGWMALRDAVTRPFGELEEMSSELHARLQEEQREMLRAASGRRARATSAVRALEATIAGRRLACSSCSIGCDGDVGGAHEPDL